LLEGEVRAKTERRTFPSQLELLVSQPRRKMKSPDGTFSLSSGGHLASFDLVLRTESSLHPDGEPSDFISEFTGVIRCTDDDNRVSRVGKVHAYRIQADLAAIHGESLFDVCDAHSHELHVCYTLLFEPDEYGFREDIFQKFQAMDADCLVLDYVLLNPKWRGLKIGLLAARKMVDLLGGGCGLVVSAILPLRRDAHDRLGVPASWIPPQGNVEEWKESVRKLRRYFRRMGFERIGRTDYFGLSMARQTPTASELLKPGR
jgi:hypothetical protein